MTRAGVLDQWQQVERASTVHCYGFHFRWRRWMESSGHEHASRQKNDLSPTHPIALDEQGELVADAFIVSIRFPRETKDTLAGHVPVVTGAGVARILVGSTTIRGVPLC